MVVVVVDVGVAVVRIYIGLQILRFLLVKLHHHHHNPFVQVILNLGRKIK